MWCSKMVRVAQLRLVNLPSLQNTSCNRCLCSAASIVRREEEPDETSLTSPIPSPHSPKATQFCEKIDRLAEEIGSLSLVEASELRQALHQKLNLPDAAALLAGSDAVMTPTSAGVDGNTDDGAEDAAVKSSFTLTLKGFEDGNKKVALIKEIRSLMADMNLVQAKKFVESLPHVVRENVGKDEAEEVMKQLEALGGLCILE